MKIINKKDLNHKELKSTKTGESFSLSSVVSDFLQSKQVFIAHDIIPAGRRASSPHRHSYIEEIIYVVKGQLTAVINESEKHHFKEGDFIFLDPKDKTHHHIENKSNESAEIIIFSMNREKDQTIYT